MDGEIALQRLRRRGYRASPLREAMMRALRSSRLPQTVGGLIACLAGEGLRPNKSSVYRELKILLREELVREVDFLEGAKRYEVSTHHHHHLVCRSCGCVQALHEDCQVGELEKRIQLQYGFKVQEHLLEFFGECLDCAST